MDEAQKEIQRLMDQIMNNLGGIEEHNSLISESIKRIGCPPPVEISGSSAPEKKNMPDKKEIYTITDRLRVIAEYSTILKIKVEGSSLDLRALV